MVTLKATTLLNHIDVARAENKKLFLLTAFGLIEGYYDDKTEECKVSAQSIIPLKEVRITHRGNTGNTGNSDDLIVCLDQVIAFFAR